MERLLASTLVVEFFGSFRSVGSGVVEVAIGRGGKVELRDFNLNRERTR